MKVYVGDIHYDQGRRRIFIEDDWAPSWGRATHFGKASPESLHYTAFKSWMYEPHGSGLFSSRRVRR